MQKFLARTQVQTSSSNKKYSMFVGRWQTWHAGHAWLINERLQEGKNVLICIRDVEPDEKNPFTPHEVLMNITDHLLGSISEGKVKIMIIPDIESINFGREVGYDVIEHIPPSEIATISATKLRNGRS